MEHIGEDPAGETTKSDLQHSSQPHANLDSTVNRRLDKKTWIKLMSEAWDNVFPIKKGRPHDDRIIKAVAEAFIEWPPGKIYTRSGIVKAARYKLESRKESFIPVKSSMWRYARLFIDLTTPLHKQVRPSLKEAKWLQSPRGMPKSEPALEAVSEGLERIMKYMTRETARPCKTTADCIRLLKKLCNKPRMWT